MLNYSIDDLRAFCYSARAGQFQEAAGLLFISASALSRRIANLEGQVGGPLFVRSTRQLKLTPLGVELHHKVSPLLAQLDAAVGQAARSVHGAGGSLSIGVVATVAYNMAPRVIETLRGAYPDLSICIHDGLATSIAALVEEGKVEFGISTQMAFGPEIDADRITEYGYVLVVSETDRELAGCKEIEWKRLVRLMLIGLGPTSSTRLQIDAEMRKLGHEMSWAVEIDQLSTIIEMVRVCRRRAVLPSLICGEHAGLRFIPIVKPNLARGLFAIRRRTHVLTPAATELLRLFTIAIQERASY